MSVKLLADNRTIRLPCESFKNMRSRLTSSQCPQRGKSCPPLLGSPCHVFKSGDNQVDSSLTMGAPDSEVGTHSRHHQGDCRCNDGSFDLRSYDGIMSESSANGKRTRYPNQFLALLAARRGVAHTADHGVSP